ncbi:Liver stage antigen, related [Neospora caninum Liverpool]|uniref:Liver stage antigen, related n=1 Tax=Neospora caninum (strain Liverpool) TaxID=572307 RepID=F0VPY9_NEOCL|nr:Liver stage antigen, related [Neospora caninum Liverpool]CBZ55786.1 Liver stage antigen, related [Neospora caninum Liverpool]CEL70529.1 TPA: Liver stage antigen, related [Neospora caninum Liverpool]|eukprot:XP_003885812.1 Liver stage antigen, related [Neospora caninum Liverpool]
MRDQEDDVSSLPKGEDGDFFSVLLQNHITGVRTPRPGRPQPLHPTEPKAAPSLSANAHAFCSSSFAPLSSWDRPGTRTAEDSRGDTSAPAVSSASNDARLGEGRPDRRGGESEGAALIEGRSEERADAKTAQVFPFLRGRAASLEILKKHKPQGNGPSWVSSRHPPPAVLPDCGAIAGRGSETDGGESGKTDQRERGSEAGARPGASTCRDGRRGASVGGDKNERGGESDERRRSGERRHTRGKSFNKQLEARIERVHRATRRATSSREEGQLETARRRKANLHPLHRSLPPHSHHRTAEQCFPRRSRSRTASYASREETETDALTGSTVHSFPSARGSFSAFERFCGPCGRPSSPSPVCDHLEREDTDGRVGRGRRGPGSHAALFAGKRKTHSHASCSRGDESPLSALSAESSTRSAASEADRPAVRRERGQGKVNERASGRGYCSSEGLGGRRGASQAGGHRWTSWGVHTPSGSDWEDDEGEIGREAQWERETSDVAWWGKRRLTRKRRHRALRPRAGRAGMTLSAVFAPPKAFSEDSATPFQPSLPPSSLLSASPLFTDLFPALQDTSQKKEEPPAKREPDQPVSLDASLAAGRPLPVSPLGPDRGLAQWLAVLRSSPQLVSTLLHSSASPPLLARNALPLSVPSLASTPSVSPSAALLVPPPSDSQANGDKRDPCEANLPSPSPPCISSACISASPCPASSSSSLVPIPGENTGRVVLPVLTACEGKEPSPVARRDDSALSSVVPPAWRASLAPFPFSVEQSPLCASFASLLLGSRGERAGPQDSGDPTASRAVRGDKTRENAKRCLLLERCRGEIREMKERVAHLRAGVESNLCDMKKWMATAVNEVGQVYVTHSHDDGSADGSFAKVKEEFEKERSAFALCRAQQEERLSLLQLQVYGLEEQLMLAETTRDKQEKTIEQMTLFAKAEAEKQREKVRSLHLELEALKEKKEDREREEERQKAAHAESVESLQQEVEQVTKEKTKMEAQLKRLTAEHEELRREHETTRARLKESEEGLRDTREREEEERKKREALLVERARGEREEEKLLEDVQRLHGALSEKEAIFTEMKTEAERVRQDLDRERQLRELREQEKGQIERELTEAKKREEEGQEENDNLQQEVTRMQRNIEQIQSQRDQESRRHAAEKERLRKQIDELELERQAMHADATARLEEHLKAEEKLREEAQNLRAQQRKKTNVEEELLATKTELQHLKDELKDLLAEEVGKRAALTEENAKQQTELENKHHLVRSLLQQKSTLEVKLQESQRRELNLQKDVRSGEEERLELKQSVADLQLERDQQKLAIQRSELEVERLKQYVAKLETSAKMHQEELCRRQAALTESLEKHESAAGAASKWKALYSSQQSAVQKLRDQLVSLHRSLLKRGEAEDAFLYLHLDRLSPKGGFPEAGEQRRESESDSETDAAGFDQAAKTTSGKETSREEQRAMRASAAKALALLLNAPVFQPIRSQGSGSRGLGGEREAREKTRAGDTREALDTAAKNGDDSASPPRSAAARSLGRAVAQEEARQKKDWLQDAEFPRFREASSGREETYTFRERRESRGDSSDAKCAVTSDEDTPRFGAREGKIEGKSRERARSSPDAPEGVSSRGVSRTSSSLPGTRVGTESRQTTASSEASESLFHRDVNDARDSLGEQRGGARQVEDEKGDVRVAKAGELLQLRTQIGELEKEGERRAIELSQLEHSVYTLEAEVRVAEEKLSRATCTCEIAFHDILAQSGRYHSSAEILQKIETAGKDLHLLPSLRQTLRAHMREKGRWRERDAEGRKKRRGKAAKPEGRDEDRDGDHEPFDEEEKVEMVRWMNHLVEETERSCYILEGAHAARDVAARERQHLQRQREALASELREKRVRLRSLDAKAKRIPGSLLRLREREQACVEALGERKQTRPLVSVPPVAACLADVVKKSAFSSLDRKNPPNERGCDEGRELGERDLREGCGRRRIAESEREKEKTNHEPKVEVAPRRGSWSPRPEAHRPSRGSADTGRGDEVPSGDARLSMKKERHVLFEQGKDDDEEDYPSSPSLFHHLASEQRDHRSSQSDNRDSKKVIGSSSADTYTNGVDDASSAWSERDVHAQSGGCSFWVAWSAATGDLEEALASSRVDPVSAADRAGH